MSKIALAGAAATIVLMSLPAQAQKLTVVEVGAPAVNCVFNPSCTITVTDSIGTIDLPNIEKAGTAWLQSRTYTGAAGTPGAGKTGYDYRVSLTEAAGIVECLGGLVLNFGPVAKLPYKDGKLADVFVVTTGGLGTIGLSSAEKFGDVIVFEFSPQLCLDGPANIKNTTFFFGLAANEAPAPKPIAAQIFAMGKPPLFEVEARVPKH